jgi:acetyltransferase-like isoleucine patch superfamily enzyme
MKYLSHFITALKNHQSNRKLLDKPKRTQQKFQQQYPHYKMGTNCYGVPNVKHEHPDALLTIGSYCSFAKNVQILLGGNHRSDWVSTYRFPVFFEIAKHIQNSAVTNGDVTIGSDVWLCQNATILSGVTIGHGAVVANGAIVTKDVAPYEIVGGNPAKHIRWRFDESTREALLASAWWDWPEEEILNVVELICSDDIANFLDYVNNRQVL